MAVLVAGGAGYIGSHTARALAEQGRDVVVYDNLSKGHREAVEGLPLVIGDIADQETLRDTIRKYGVDAVIHFAASIEVGESMKEPEAYYFNNVVGTLHLLKSLRAAGVGRIVFSSTAAVYGNPAEDPITENCKKGPINVYGRTKWMMEQTLADYQMAYGLRYAALRYFNASGAHPDGDIGEDHSPESHLIPLIIQAALGQRDDIKIYGTDYPTEDGTCIRDYIHVCDLAQAHILALDTLEKGTESLALNLGNGNGFSVREVIDTVKRVTGRKITVREADRRPGDPPVLVACSDEARDVLGWEPEFASIERIVETAWNWHRVHPDGDDS